MFKGCTSLITAPSVLPTTGLAPYCYSSMFYGCTSLTTAPSLPATLLADSCYGEMFRDCTSLTTAPSLPATTLVDYCYNYMFKDCTGLTTAPSLPATTLKRKCYYEMFRGCTNLNKITCLATDISASGCTTNWVNGVAASGTFIKPASMTSWKTGNNGIPTGWVTQDYYASQYLTFEAIESGTFKFSGNAVSYSVDNGSTWTSLASNTDTPTVPAGGKIIFKATLTPSWEGIGKFSSTGRFTAQGNPMSLLYGDNFIGQTSLSEKDYAFYGLFYNCTGLTSAENMSLPATTVTHACYANMFYGCTSLINAPSLPATTLATYCYYGMFASCTSLTTTPSLPATTLADSCYYDMFKYCTSLTTAPSVLPATTLANSCYQYMFAGCTSLANTPVLSATTLANYCYNGMFAGCTSLTTAPELPATTLASYCYQYMFSGCTSLTNAPELPATTLTSNCYYGMFNGCTSLTNAPELPATTLTSNCYYGMFNGCGNLNKITCLATDISASNCTYNWVSGVAASGTFTKADSMIGWEIDSVNGIPSGWTAQGYYSLRYLTFVATDSGAFGFTNNINYSLDEGVTWTTLARNTPTPTILAGDKIMFKATLTPQMYAGIGTFHSSGKFIAQGNPMSLLYGDNFIGQTAINDFCFFNLFIGNTGLTSAKNLSLPATTLTFFGYFGMFSGCTSLTTAPELPATTLADYCYSGMFGNCTSLTNAPALPATTLASDCYDSMFSGCTSLTTAPSVLPATTLAGNCYISMFEGCTSLTTAPVLPATTLIYSCYYCMFSGCTNLNSITCLATDISAYSCTSNWVSGVAATGTFLKAASMTSWTTGNDGIPTGWVTQEYYSYIYLTFEAIDNCQFSVNRNTVSYSIDNGTTWLSGYRTSTIQAGNKVIFKANLTPMSNYGIGTFSSTGRFKAMGNPMSLLYGDDFRGRTDLTEKNYAFSNLFSGCTGLTSAENLRLPATTLSFGCYYSMFRGCTSLTNAPSLPATTLADYCYSNMFNGCTMLTTAPSLPATTLAYQCYSDMFNGCTSLTTAPVLSATTLAPSCYGSMFANCTSLRIAPTLPATTLASNCYQTMFSGCTSLTIAPGLPVTTLAELCYHAMFSNCTSLTTAPVLPATTLQEDCYSRMFEYCTSLTTAPELKAATLAAYCYDRMFRGCTNLNSITCLATDISANNCTNSWVSGVAATGTFIKGPSMTGWTTGNDGIPSGWTVKDYGQSLILYDYIENTGTSYIDTTYEIGLNNMNTIKYYVDFVATGYNRGNNWWAHGIGGGEPFIYVGLDNGSSSSTNIPFVYGGGNRDVTTSAYGSLNQRYKCLIDYQNLTYKVTNEGGSVLLDSIITIQAPSTSTARSPYLFAWRRGSDGALGYTHSGRIYACTIFANNVCVRNLIPCIYNGTPGMYDTVNNQFHGNLGGGTFIVGNRI